MNFQFFQTLCRTLSPFMTERNTLYRAAIPMKKPVAMGLWCLGTGIVTFGLGNCIRLNIVHKFAHALLHVREDYISFPSSGRALGNVINKLELKYGLLEAADVIDATHMKIKKIMKHCVIERGQSWIRNPWRHVYLFRLVWGVARVWYFLYMCGEQNKPFFYMFYIWKKYINKLILRLELSSRTPKYLRILQSFWRQLKHSCKPMG